MIKLGAQELRTSQPTPQDLARIKKNPIYIVLDNVLDTYNIGSIFRLADAVAAEQILLCGETQTPPNNRIKKASINTTEWVDWQYFGSAESAIENLIRQHGGENLRVYAVEQSPKSVRYDQVKYEFPLAVIVGNETYGVSKSVLQMADEIVEIPMFGVNKSLNVMVSCAVVLFEAVKGFQNTRKTRRIRKSVNQNVG